MAKYEAIPVIVDAFPIAAVSVTDGPLRYDGGNVRVFTVLLEGTETKIQLEPGMTARYTPKVGDYYVVQADHYIYINPKEVFERKYKAMN